MKLRVGLAVTAVFVTLAVPASASGPGWSRARTPNPLARTGQLSWVSCPTATRCIAVGTYVDASGTGLNLSERWDGTSWSRLSAPNPRGAQVTQPMGITCTSSSSCLAVGQYIDGRGRSHAFAQRWNGTTWHLLAVPEPPGSQSSLLSIDTCSSSSSCVAVGNYTDRTGTPRTLAERWDGTTWKVQPTPNPRGAQFSILSGVACTSSTACEAVGLTSRGALAEQWKHRRWSIQSTPSPAPRSGLFSLSCTSPSACLAVGTTNTSSPGPILAERWNGTKWVVRSTPNPAGAQGGLLNSVSCSSASACTAVGVSFDSSSNSSTVAERWDGHAWSLQSTRNEPEGSQLVGVACPKASLCVAVGSGVDASGASVTVGQRWNGTRWSLQPTINPRGIHGAQLAGVSCRSSSFCVAVGGTSDSPSGNPRGTLAQVRNGKSWRIVPTPNALGASRSALNGVSCTARSNCVAVGGGFGSSGNPVGTLTERWNGTSWNIQPTPTSTSAGGLLNAVSCTSPSACTSVGTNSAGAVMAERWDGKSWTVQPMPAPAGAPNSFLTGVSCTSATVCVAVGAAVDSSFNNSLGTVAERWNGTTWTLQPSPTSQRKNNFLAAVACTSALACIAVGNTATGLLAERWNGTAWTIQRTVTPSGTERSGDFFNGVSCSSSSACTAVGLLSANTGPPSTVAERWDGSHWAVQPMPGIPGAYDMAGPAVSCPTLTVCTAVGGYRSDGPTVTLAEQWNGAGPTAALSSGFPAAASRLNFGALGLARRSMALDQIPGRGDALHGAPR